MRDRSSGNINHEKRILGLFRSGDPSAVRALYREYAGYLTAVCARYISSDEDIEDILQESFLAILDDIPKFEYRGSGTLKAWMARIVVNRSLKHLRESRRMTFTDLTEDILTEVPDTGGMDGPDTGQMPPEAIHGLIRGLPDGYRTIFNLYVLEKRSHREIAGLLGITESTSASQLHRAKAMLATMIRNYQKDTQ